MEAYIPDEVLLSTQTDRPEKVFISYAHAEAEIVNRIFVGLKARGHDVWYDQQNIKHGDDWREKIARGIESSNGVLSFLSREAVKKDGVCLDELAIAVGVKYGNIHTVLLEKEEEVRPPSQLTHRQWLDMSDWQDMLRQGETVFQPWFDSKLADIIRVVESDESREFVGQISSIREKLHIGDLAVSRQHWYLAQKYVGRAWLTQDIEAWLDDPKGGRLCTVYGGPGVGKSAFAAQYAYRSPRVAASIFFEHGNEHFNTAGALIRELIFQLACRIPLYRNRVYGIVMTDDQIKTWNDQELFAHLIKAPLADFQINGGHETLCIVVDGLDECTRDEHNGAAELLGKYVKEFPAWLRVLVLSRHENSVTGWLDPDHQIDMLGGETRNLADIRQYFAETLEKQLAAQPHADALLDELTGHTEGVFLYAYVVSRMILDGKLDMADTQAYPKGLNSAFREWFRRYFPDTFAYKRLYRLYLGMIAASPEPIPVEELEDIDVRYDPDEDCYELNTDKSGTRRRGTRQERLRSITSLLQYRTNQFGKRTVAFTHRYIAQWLTQTDDETNDSPAGCYSCNPQDALWAMECSWRQKLKSGDGLTEYEALHLIEFMRQVEKDQETLKTAKSEALEEALEGFYEQYKEQYQYAAVLQFRLCYSEIRAFIRNCTGDKDDERAYLVSLSGLASTYDDLGRYGEALALYERVYELRKQILGEGHPDTLTAMSNLAVTYSDLGRLDEALTLKEQVLDLRKQILGEKHPDTLTAMSNLAVTYIALGRLDEALAIGKQVLDLCKQILGEKHPNTLSAMGNLAVTYRDLGRLDEALALEKQVLDLRKQILGEKHPNTLTAMNNLAVTYSNLGRLDEALTLKEQVFDLRKQILGEKHPGTLTAMSNLAATYRDLGRLDEALAIGKQVLDLRKQILGEKHPDTLTDMNNLAVTYSDLGRLDEALALEEQALDLSKQILGEKHPVTLIAMGTLAVTYSALGRLDEALVLEEQVLDLRKQILGEKNPATLTAMANLAATYSDLGRLDEALALQEKVYELRKQVLGENHRDTLSSMKHLAITYYDLARFQDAVVLEEKVYELRMQNQGNKHSDTLTAMSNLALTYKKLGRMNEALALQQKVYELRKQVLGEEHRDTLSSMKHLAITYYDLARYQDAVVLEEKVYALRKRIQGEEHPDTLFSMNNLAMTYSKLGRFAEAFPLMKYVYETRRRTLGEEHRLTQKAYRRMEEFRQHLPVGE